MRYLSASLVVALVLTAQTALAWRVEYATDRPEVLSACDRALYQGREAEANNCYRDLLAGEEDPRIQAEAARALGDPSAANGYFQTAIETYPEDPALRVRWGALFAETHKENDAVQLYMEALGINSEYIPALTGLAEIAAGRFEGKAREWIDQALAIEPDDLAAHLLLARMDLEEGSVDAGDESLSRALEIAERDGVPA